MTISNLIQTGKSENPSSVGKTQSIDAVHYLCYFDHYYVIMALVIVIAFSATILQWISPAINANCI